MSTDVHREAKDIVLKTQTELHGLTDSHLLAVDRYCIHPKVFGPLNSLCYRAAQAGYRVRVVSAWRSFERQQKIWNEKAEGQRPIFDESGAIVSRDAMSDEEAMWAILKWSALPGASRHHWGTDIDVVDGACIPAGYQVKLTVDETIEGGPFAGMHRWLDGYLSQPACPFFRPYRKDEGGVAPEPWHLSYAPQAMYYQKLMTEERLRQFIESVDIALKSTILANLDEIFARFVSVDWQRYPSVCSC